MNRIKSNIIVLERYEGLRESLSLILEDYYNLLFANSIEDVLGYLASSHMGLFIMDIDGISNSLKIVKQVKRKHPDLKILLLSGKFVLSFQEKAVRAGTDIRFQEKPFNPKELLERVDTLVRGHSLKRHHHIVSIKNPNPK